MTTTKDTRSRREIPTRTLGLAAAAVLYVVPFLFEFDGLSDAGHRMLAIFLVADEDDASDEKGKAQKNADEEVGEALMDFETVAQGMQLFHDSHRSVQRTTHDAAPRPLRCDKRQGVDLLIL